MTAVSEALSMLLGALLVWTLLSLIAHVSWRREFGKFDAVTFWLTVGFSILAAADFAVLLVMGVFA